MNSPFQEALDRVRRYLTHDGSNATGADWAIRRRRQIFERPAQFLALAALASTLLFQVWPAARVSEPITQADDVSGSASPVSDGVDHTIDPAAAPAPEPNFLSTSGSKIVDSKGRSVQLTGVNWFGMETQTFSPHGLWARNWQDMLDQIAAAGFNTIRLPYSNVILDPNARPMEGIDYKLNSDLKGLAGLEILDMIVEGAGKRGLKVILDRHRPDAQAQSKLWYTDFLSEERWITDWQTLAKRYLGNDTVIGADLHNEPAGDAKWAEGDPKHDWRAAAERAGNAILDANPHWLIIVEGVERIDKDWYWMGGNLANAGRFPVNLKIPNKLVYSAHDYGPGVYDQEWFKDRRFPANMPEIWDKHWGYLVKEGIAPVLLGEFGGKSVDLKDREGVWQRALLDYLRKNEISYTYWSFNPNSVDTGGILKDDWRTADAAKGELLRSYASPALAVNRPSAIDKAAVALSPYKNALPAQPIKVQLVAADAQRSSELLIKLFVVNQTAANVPLGSVELRYWLSANEAPLVAVAKSAKWPSERVAGLQPLSINWAGVEGVVAELVSSTDNVPPYLRVGFEKSGTLPGLGKLEVQLKLVKPDKVSFDQSRHFSYRSARSPMDADAVGLYYWGNRIWGGEPVGAGSAG